MTNIEQARLLLPWYATGALDDSEKRVVEHALRDSPELQQELHEQDFMFDIIKKDQSVLDISVVNTVEQRLDDLLGRIDVYENSIQPDVRATSEDNSVSNFKSKLNAWLSELFSIPAMRYATAGMAAILMIQVVVFMGFQLASPDQGATYKPVETDMSIVPMDANGQPTDLLNNMDNQQKADIVLMFDSSLSKESKDIIAHQIIKNVEAEMIYNNEGSNNRHIRLKSELSKHDFNALLRRIDDTPGVSRALEGENKGAKQ